MGFVTTTFPQNSDFLPNEKQNPGYFVDFYVTVVGFKLHELMKNELFGLLFENNAEGRSYEWKQKLINAKVIWESRGLPIDGFIVKSV